MINGINIEIFDFVFSTNIDLRGEYLENNNVQLLCSKLDTIIEQKCDKYDFWNQYKSCFNDNCVIDSSTLDGESYIYNGFPRMKLGTKSKYLNYKLMQVKDLISNNGDFIREEFQKITTNLGLVAQKEILDFCEEVGIIRYKGKPFISADNCPALAIIYDNIEPVLYTKEEVETLMVQNAIIVNGDNNSLNNITQKVKINSDDELFELVLSKLELLEKDGVSREDLLQLEKACKERNSSKVVDFLEDIASNVIGGVVATGILSYIGLN